MNTKEIYSILSSYDKVKEMNVLGVFPIHRIPKEALQAHALRSPTLSLTPVTENIGHVLSRQILKELSASIVLATHPII